LPPEQGATGSNPVRRTSLVCFIWEDVQKVHPARPQAAKASRRNDQYVEKGEQRERSWWIFSTFSVSVGPLAQLVEQLTLNQRAVGSTPTRPTIYNDVKASLPMKTLQEIEKAIETLPLPDRLRLYRDMPLLIGREVEDLDWQRLALDNFFQDDSPDDQVYDQV
jgi:hypothetical protein